VKHTASALRFNNAMPRAAAHPPAFVLKDEPASTSSEGAAKTANGRFFPRIALPFRCRVHGTPGALRLFKIGI